MGAAERKKHARVSLIDSAYVCRHGAAWAHCAPLRRTYLTLRSACLTAHLWLSDLTPLAVWPLTSVCLSGTQEVKPFIDDWIEDGTYPTDLHRRAHQAGVSPIIYRAASDYFDPSELAESADHDAFHELILWDELARVGGGGVLGQLSINSMALPPIISAAPEHIKQLVVRSVVQGTAALATAQLLPFLPPLSLCAPLLLKRLCYCTATALPPPLLSFRSSPLLLTRLPLLPRLKLALATAQLLSVLPPFSPFAPLLLKRLPLFSWLVLAFG